MAERTNYLESNFAYYKRTLADFPDSTLQEYVLEWCSTNYFMKIINQIIHPFTDIRERIRAADDLLTERGVSGLMIIVE